MLLDAAQVTLWLTLIGAVVGGALKIIAALKENTAVTVKGQIESKERSDAIHVLVNSNTDKLKETIAQLQDLLAAANDTIRALKTPINRPTP